MNIDPTQIKKWSETAVSSNTTNMVKQRINDSQHVAQNAFGEIEVLSVLDKCKTSQNNGIHMFTHNHYPHRNSCLCIKPSWAASTTARRLISGRTRSQRASNRREGGYAALARSEGVVDAA